MVGLVHDNDVSKLFDPAEAFRIFTTSHQVRVVVYRQIAVLAEKLRQILPQLASPKRACARPSGTNRATRLRWRLIRDSISIKPMNVLPRPTPSHKNAPWYWFCNARQLVVSLLLVVVENFIHLSSPRCGPSGQPFVVGHLMPTEELVKGSCIDVKRGIQGRLALDHLRISGVMSSAVLPVPLVPFLQDFNFSAELHIEFDVIGQPGNGEVA